MPFHELLCSFNVHLFATSLNCQLVRTAITSANNSIQC